MKTFDTLVVGAGLFGQVIAKALAKQGRSVVVMDDSRPMNGTAPSGMLMKPSWFAGLGSKIYDPALEVMNNLYDIQELKFKVGPKTTSALYVPHDQVMSMDVTPYKVLKVEDNGHVLVEQGDNKAWLQFKLVVIAAGIWSNELTEVPKLEGKQGVSFIWNVPVSENWRDNFIMPWAPYKQVVGFRRSEKEIWAGDGTAIKPENWKESRVDECLKRCRKHVKLERPPKAIMGIRPYVKGAKPAYVRQQSDHVWVATGGAKNGTIAAGWAAHVIVNGTS
ncbi:MAG: hypothetical protein AMS18_09370 [Gemmatimonas sp. SG8_17]|nr:MAG: hypothetical protein AMS18_09370 [Gemmatimonas sp. SG8_17]